MFLRIVSQQINSLCALIKMYLFNLSNSIHCSQVYCRALYFTTSLLLLHLDLSIIPNDICWRNKKESPHSDAKQFCCWSHFKQIVIKCSQHSHCAVEICWTAQIFQILLPGSSNKKRQGESFFFNINVCRNCDDSLMLTVYLFAQVSMESLALLGNCIWGYSENPLLKCNQLFWKHKNMKKKQELGEDFVMSSLHFYKAII